MNSFARILRHKPFILIVSLPENSVEMAKLCADSGADAVRVHTNLVHAVTGRKFGTISEERRVLEQIRANVSCPLGIYPGIDGKQLEITCKMAAEIGIDYIDLPSGQTPPLHHLLENKSRDFWFNISFNCIPEASMSWIPYTGVIASAIGPEGYGKRLSVQDLALYGAFVQLTKCDVIVPTDRYIVPEDVFSLVKVGVKALMIGAIVTGYSCESVVQTVTTYKAAIDQVFLG